LSFLQLALGEFGLLELCRLTLFKFRTKILKTKGSPIHPPLGPSILTEGKAHDQRLRPFLHGDLLLEAAVQSRGVGELEMPMAIECEKGRYFPWRRLFQGIRLSGMGDASGRWGTVSTVGFSL
jgi:hypothetical protein